MGQVTDRCECEMLHIFSTRIDRRCNDQQLKKERDKYEIRRSSILLTHESICDVTITSSTSMHKFHCLNSKNSDDVNLSWLLVNNY